MNPIKENTLFQLFQQVNERIWYYDTATDRICYVSSNGNTEEAIPFDEHMAMKHPDDRQQVYDSMEYMIRTRKPWPSTLMIRYHDNSQPDGYRYTLNAIVPIFEGDCINVVGSEQDITPMVRKQQLAEKQTQIIEELLRRRHEDTWTIDIKTKMMRLKYADGTEESLSLEELINRIDVEESSDAIKAIKDFNRGESKVFEFHIKDKYPRKDGTRHYFKCTSMPSKYDFHGNVTEYVGVGTDVTREIADQRKLKQALAEAKEQNYKKSVFVARASHDLRNPLNALLSISELMCMDIPVEERKELNDLMKQGGEALLTLINDILDLTRFESGIQFQKEDFDISGLVEDVVQSFQISSGKSHNIIFEKEVTKPTVTSDSKRLVQLINNYISNAIKYSPEGSDIIVTLRSTDAELYIAVADHGCGISEKDHHRVFDEFARFNTEVNGTGLGLSICKRIAEGLGGTVGFQSQEGEGSTFWVKISESE